MPNLFDCTDSFISFTKTQFAQNIPRRQVSLFWLKAEWTKCKWSVFIQFESIIKILDLRGQKRNTDNFSKEVKRSSGTAWSWFGQPHQHGRATAATSWSRWTPRRGSASAGTSTSGWGWGRRRRLRARIASSFRGRRAVAAFRRRPFLGLERPASAAAGEFPAAAAAPRVFPAIAFSRIAEMVQFRVTVESTAEAWSQLLTGDEG